jgi:hypothetical protein
MAVALLASTLVIASTGVVLASNSAPTAHDQTFTTNGEPIEVTLYAQDGDGDKLTLAVLAEPQKGTLSGTAPSFLYSPSAAFDGSDSFTWKANDGSSESGLATVSITGTSSSSSSSTAPSPAVQASTTSTTSTVSFQSSSTASSGDLPVTSLVVPAPSGVASGDVMWMHLSIVRPEVSPNMLVMDPAVPAGWVLIRELEVGLTVRSYLYRKVAGIEPGGYTLTFGVPLQAAAGIGMWRGANPYVFAVSEATAIAATSITVPGVFGWAGGRVAGFFATLGGSVGVPTQMTPRWHAAAGLSQSVRSLSVGGDEAVNGAIGPRTAKSRNRLIWIGHLISLKPKT